VAQFDAGQSITLALEDGTTVELAPDEVLVRSHAREGYGVAGEGELVIALDMEITPELAQEGLAREIVRRIQDLRKQADYDLADRIAVQYCADPQVAEAIAAQRQAIADEVLADAIEAVDEPTGDKVEATEVDGEHIVLAVRRVA
jgi:isoleucyl-tRNA synthetase